MQKRLLIYICVTAGKQESVQKTIRDRLKVAGVDHRIRLVEKPTDIFAALRRAKLDSYTGVAVYGGDGSVIQACKALTEHNLPLLILPGGTANVLASYFGMPDNLEACLDMYVSRMFIIRRTDLADINGNPFVLDMHSGLWTQAIIDTPRRLKRRAGKAAYGWSALRKLTSAKPHTYEFTIDKRPPEQVQAYTFLAANQGDHNVLGAPLFPYRHAPGMVQLALIKDIRLRWLAAWLLWKKLTGRHLRRVIEVRRAHTVRIDRSPRNLLVDDAKTRAELPIRITGGRYSVRLFLPAAASPRSPVRIWYSRTKLLAHRVWQRFKVMLPGSTPTLRHSHVAPGVYLGGKYPARAYKTFGEWGVTGIISMRTTASADAPLGFSLLRLPTKDWHPPELADLDKGVSFVHHHIEQGGAVYIHCQLGEGRGPTMAAAYLITKGLSVEEAVDQLARYRPFVRPNGRQLRRLAEWQDYYNRKKAKTPK